VATWRWRPRSQRPGYRALGEDLGERTLYHGHSYSGNALAAAVALAHLRLFDDWDVLANVVARAAQVTELLDDLVADLPEVGAVRQQGLMVGIELAPPPGATRWGRRVSAECVRRGVLIRPLGDVVVLMPILTSTEDEIERIVTVVAESITAVGADPAGAG
jgi:adenosylmethionine-8-amino-7-oxononanoate aminotransferase